MINYIEEFLDRNQFKSFFTNLMHYMQLNFYGKLKCITSFYTHLVIDAELHNIDNKIYRIELLSMITQYELNGIDNFLGWLDNQTNNKKGEKINEKTD